MKSMIQIALAKHIGKNELYAKCQHGFRPNRSCVTQLMDAMEDFTKELDTGENIDVITWTLERHLIQCHMKKGY